MGCFGCSAPDTESAGPNTASISQAATLSSLDNPDATYGVGSVITLNGSGFGSEQGAASWVAFNSPGSTDILTVVTWTDSKIEVELSSTSYGSDSLELTIDGARVASVPITVRAACPADSAFRKALPLGDTADGYSVIRTVDCGFVVAGRVKLPNRTDYDAFLLKTDADGNIATDEGGAPLWPQYYGASCANSVAAIAAGDGHTCVLSLEGEVSCWGIDDDSSVDTGQTDVPPDLSGVTVLAAGNYNNCIGTDSGVSCWGADDYGQSSPPSDLQAVTELSLGIYHSCAIADGAVRAGASTTHRAANQTISDRSATPLRT